MSYKRMWEIRQSAMDSEALDIYIYGYVENLTYDWTEHCFKEAETSANAFRKALDEHKEAKLINIHINSWGGDVIEGNAIYNLLRRHPAQKVVYIDAFACSIASVIAMAGDKVLMPRNAMMMIHNMSWGVYGNSAEIRKAADDLEVINGAGRSAYLDKAGDKLDEATLIGLMNAETWLTAERCFELGLCDEIEQRDANMSEASEVVQKMTKHMEQRIETYQGLAAQLRYLVDFGKSKDAKKMPATDTMSEAAGEEPPKEQKQDKKPVGLLSRFNHEKTRKENAQ